MKKSLNNLFLISLVLILSLSLISAFSFSDFWNKITGKTTGNETEETTPTCTESWTCTDWSSCAESHQTRTCTDSENCGTNSSMPTESQSCSSAFFVLIQMMMKV